MKTLASLHSSREALSSPSPIGTSLSSPGLTVLLARSGEAKARILSSLQQGLSPAMRPQQSWTAPVAPRPEAFIIHAQDLNGAAGGAELPTRLAAAGSPERAARVAIGALRAQAASLLGSDDGGGRITQLTARLRELDERLEAALEAEAAERARLEPLLADATALAELDRQRERLLAERDHWQALMSLSPDWQRLQQARADVERLAKFERVPDDAEERQALLAARCERAEKALRGSRREVGELINERQELRETAPALPPGAAAVVRSCAELPLYRSRLLQLAATRARLADLERTLLAGLRRLNREWDLGHLSELDLLIARRDELQRWQERSERIHAAHADAKCALEGVRAQVHDLCRQVNERLAGEPVDTEDPIDVQWRSLWKLRGQLEEIWDVQSRAETNARAMTDREDALRGLDTARYRSAPRWLLGTLTFLAATAAAVLSSGAWRGRFPGAVLAAITTLLVLLRLTLHVRARWVAVMEQRRGAHGERLRREIDGTRRRRDAGWTRAGRLADTIREASGRLALPDQVTPEAVEACEQELAARLRSGGAHTPLTSLVRDLLDAQDGEQQGAAQLAETETAQRALAREWQEWRNESGFPVDIEIERGAGWLDELRRLADARAVRAATADELQAIEPVTAAWETDARSLLQEAGVEVRQELCGSALATELTALGARLRRETERKDRRACVESALRDAEQRLVEAEAELASARKARLELLSANGVSDEEGLRAQLDGWRHWRAARDQALELQTAMDDRLAGLAASADARGELENGQNERWETERRRCDAQLEKITEQLDDAAQQRRTAERCLDAARAAMHVGDLRLEREEVRAELADVTREWKLRVLAAALLEAAAQEHKRTARRELLHAASRTLATLTRGRYTSIDRSEQPTGLALIDCEGRRVPIGSELDAGLLGQVNLSLLLGRAAQLASRGASLPFVLDDVLGPLPLDEAHLVAQEIATLARAHPVLYVTTSARRGDILSAMPSGVAVYDVE